MYIQRLDLQNFRNYARQSLCPDRGLTILTGANAQGKTNILEALHLCCLGRSHRTAHDKEMIRWGCERAKVAVAVKQQDGTHEIEVILSEEARKKKTVKIGGSQVSRIGELMGQMGGVFFVPEDLLIVKEGPVQRRQFLDRVLSQLRPSYFYALQRYARALKQRTGLLREIAKRGALLSTLDSWDEQLAAAGAEVVKYRAGYVEKLHQAARTQHASIAGEAETLSLCYKTQLSDGKNAAERRAQFMALLQKTRENDLRRQMTSVGPHRDELEILLNDRSARMYASQGQQRSIVLSMKLAELQVAGEVRGEMPILLLDDVMSELDPLRRQRLIQRIDGVQTILTCTHLSDLGGASYGMAYRVENGKLHAL